MSRAYNLIKAVDPYHITVAGIVCDSSWLWSDTAPSLVAPTADPSAAVIAEGHQPRTQLSLDMLVHENYNGNLGKMSGVDNFENVTVNHSSRPLLQTRDADSRRGVPFMPIGNALEPPKFPVYSCPDYPRVGKALLDGNCVHSALWLGTITADMRSSMHWIALPGFWNTSTKPYNQQIGRYSREIAALRATVGGSFETPRPAVTISDIVPNFEFEYPVLRAGAWRAAGSACTTVVVVNNWQEMNVSFALAVHGAPSGATVVRRFAFAPHYNSSVLLASVGGDGNFRDTMSPGNAQIYSVGCG